MKHLIAIIIMSLALIACDDSGRSSDTGAPVGGIVSIDCVSVGNASGECSVGLAAVMMAGAVTPTIVDVGIVSRGTMIQSSLSVINETPDSWAGKYSMTFDAGCNGAETWEIVPMQGTGDIAASASWGAGVGGECGDMALGDRTLTASLYEMDGVTLLDQVIVQFSLTE